MVSSSKIKPADPLKVRAAEHQIRDYAKSVKFTVTEYSFEHIVQRLNGNRYYVPGYQREHTWSTDKQSRFIESIFMGLPIPFLFFWQDQEGRMEIVDGSQRIRTIRDFMENKLVLRGLEAIPLANGLRYADFSPSRQLKFVETSIRVIILDNATDGVTRTEMFARINTGGTTATEAEVRRGSLPGPFMDVIISLADSPVFVKLTPINKQLSDKREREELVTRYFAYLESFDINAIAADGSIGDIPDYKEEPRKFYFTFVKAMNERVFREIAETGNSPTARDLSEEFKRMLTFVEKISPNGFTKSAFGGQVPRVRFESIAVGSALALRAKPDLFDRSPSIAKFLNSEEYKRATTSDAANVKSKLLKRIKMTRDWLLAQ